MKINEIILVTFICLLFVTCQKTKPAAAEITEESITEEEMAEETPAAKREMTLNDQLIAYLKAHQFDQASQLIEDNQLDINELNESNRGPKWLAGSSFLSSLIYHCDAEIISYLLRKKADPNLSTITYGYDEWNSENISEGTQLKDLQEQGFDGYTTERTPLAYSLDCEDSTIFYMLIEAGANNIKDILIGGIRWSDFDLISSAISKNVKVDFVPATDRREILELLVPVTDGTPYGEIGYGEGGDMFDSDLMYACEADNSALVWFMLETGADPNHCLPKNYVDGEYVEPNSLGYYPASTPLSIAKAQYNSNMGIHSSRENDTTYLQKAHASREIIKMLEEHGATDITKCLGP